jgi:hypothetical protein
MCVIVIWQPLLCMMFLHRGGIHITSSLLRYLFLSPSFLPFPRGTRSDDDAAAELIMDRSGETVGGSAGANISTTKFRSVIGQSHNNVGAAYCLHSWERFTKLV